MESLYFKNKVTGEIAEYDSVMSLFYVKGKNFKDTGHPIPISPLTVSGDPNWEEYTGPVDTEDPLTKARNKFFNWLGL